MDEERYEFTRIIGKGRTGGVYEATDHELQRKVAVRRFFCARGNSAVKGWEDDFRALAQNLCNLHHPSLLGVLEANIDEDGAYMIYQLIEGETLAKRIDREPLAEKDVYEIAEQLLDALQVTHNGGFVHGALSTGSITLIDRPSGGYRAMITDLGLSKLAPLIQGVDSAYARMSDPVIMPPEMFDDKEATSKSDLYMVGHLLYLSLIGGHPFADQDLAELARSHREGLLPPITDYRDDLCPKFVEWISRLTESNIKKRFSGASEALHSLPVLTPESERTAPSSSAPKLIVPKLPNKVIHTSKVETIPVYIPPQKSNGKLIIGISSAAAVLGVAALTLLATDKDSEASPEDALAHTSPEPLIEEASIIPTLYSRKRVNYAHPLDKPIGKADLSITDKLCDDWAVYEGASIDEHTSYHPAGEIIGDTQVIGEFDHLHHPVELVRFNQRGSSEHKIPALHANSKDTGLDPSEGWRVKLTTPFEEDDPTLKVYAHFTTWNCDAILTFKDKQGEVIGEPRRYDSQHTDTSFGIIEQIQNLTPGDVIFLEITAGEPKSDKGMGLSLNGLKIKARD